MKKVLAGALVALLTAAAAFAFDATVVSTKGKAEILKGAAWQPLAMGATVSKGDVIQTGFKSSVVLKIKETTVTMDALSRLTVEQLAEKESKDETRLFLDTGSLKSDVQRSENRRVGFTVRSPVATASVRGTIIFAKQKFSSTIFSAERGRFVVRKEANGEAQVATEAEDVAPEIPVEVEIAENDRGTVSVSEGQSTNVVETQVAATPTQTQAAVQATQTSSATTTQAAAETVVQTTAVTSQEAPAVIVETKSNGPAKGRVIIPISIDY